jgi:hypothetical protein
VVLEAVDQLLVVAELAVEHLGVLHHRRLERLEAVALGHAREHAHDVLPQEHGLRQVVAHPFDVLYVRHRSVFSYALTSEIGAVVPASWPQAAAIATPRSARTVQATP